MYPFAFVVKRQKIVATLSLFPFDFGKVDEVKTRQDWMRWLLLTFVKGRK